MEYLPGPVPEDFDFDFYDYHVGDTWCYVIEHPKGKIVIDQSASTVWDKVSLFTTSADVLIQGPANRENDEAVIHGYVKLLKPKLFVPTHFDNFFFPFNPKEKSELPGMKLEELMEKLKKANPGVMTVVPEYGESIELLK